MEQAFGPDELAHAIFDVGWEVEGAEEAYLVAIVLEDLAHFEGEHGAVGVAGDGVRAVWLGRFDRGVICCDGFSDACEVGFAGVETSGAESVDGPIEDVFGEVDEDEDFADTG